MNGAQNTPTVINFFNMKKASPNTQVDEKKRNRKQKQVKQDVMTIHSKILRKLDEEFKKLPELKAKLDKLTWIINNSTDNAEKRIATKKFTDLNIQIELIESGFRQANYIYKTENIIKNYTKILEEPVKIDFMGNKQSGQEEKKQDILFQFLNIAQYYMDIPVYESRVKSTICEDCKIELQKEDDYIYVCKGCGYSIKHLVSTASYQENNRINVAQRYVYDKRIHFGDAIKKFQAKQNTTIPQKVYDDIETRMRNHEISSDRLNKNHLFEFLRLNGHSEHYEDITLIYCTLTGNKPPDISHLENDLFKLFDEIDPVYETVKPPDRVNFLNGQFTLFKLLQKLQFPCREEDFYILKTREKLIEQDKIWKKMCNELNWTYIATV